jgi:hypothetical protein
MRYNSIVLDEEAVSIFSYAALTSEWFNDFMIPPESSEIVKRVEIEGAIYLLSKKAHQDSRLLVIKLEEEMLFESLENKDKSVAFDRIITIALSHFNKEVTPGKSWGRYVEGNKESIYASNNLKAEKKRIFFDTSPLDTPHIFAYKLLANSNIQKNDSVDEDLFINLIDKYDTALETSSESLEDTKQQSGQYGIQLTDDLLTNYGNEYSLERWYDNELTSEQKMFVDKPYDGPVRLKGAAGTGKTVALTVKFIKDAFTFEKQKDKKRLLFITHSYASSSLVQNLLNSMDKDNKIINFEHVDIKLTSLYDLAQDLLNYNFKNIEPLSTDGKEGRQLQLEILEDVISKKSKDLKFKVSILDKCDDKFKERFLSTDNRFFVLELLNEFACVLDAENIVKGKESADKYITARREDWQMHLKNKEERKLVLDLHSAYRDYLKEIKVLSMDQMIADLNRYLLSYEWSHINNEVGYDGIFIDELHCFTRPERMVFHQLYRNSNGLESTKVPLFMAYDIKQSNDDGFINTIKSDTGSALFGSTRVGKSKLVELTKVFRYTQQIASFLNDLDGSFPALDLASEWNSLSLDSELSSVELPTLTIYDSNIALLDDVFKQAHRFANNYKKTVAVLCGNFELFEKYVKLGRILKYREVVSSRDEVFKVSKIKNKCIFSMPEYVAGLQFDMVYLINVDKNELDDDNPSTGALRRFVSTVYLGASRSKSSLKIASSNERRGYSPILQTSIDNGSLQVL